MPLMPVTVTFDEAILPAMLDGLVRLNALDASLQLISGMSTGDEIAGLKSAIAAVAAVRSMIDEAVMRAVAESN